MKNFTNLLKLNFQFILVLLLLINLNAHAQDFISVGIGGGGGLFSPSINPTDGDEFYISCDLGALFQTNDLGGNYEIIDFNEVQSGVFGKVCFTNNDDIRYILKWNQDEYARLPAKSTDGGLSWNYLTGDSEPWEDKYFIYSDYNNPNRIVWSTYDNIYISLDGGDSEINLYTANTDNGMLLSGVYFDGDDIYFGTNDGVIISNDGGQTASNANYSGIPTDQIIMGFGAGSSNGTTRFFALTGGDGDVYCDNLGNDYWGTIQGVYAMDNISGTWTSKMNGINISEDYAVYLSMATNDPNTCYIAGGRPTEKPLVMKTNDGGNTWEDVFLTNNNENIFSGYQGDQGDLDYWWGGNAMGFTVNPLDANQVLITDLGFAHMSTDGAQTWHQKYLDEDDENPAGSSTPQDQSYKGVGLQPTSVWQVYFFDQTNIFGCFTDIKGVRSEDSGTSWSMDYTGHNLNTMYHIAKHQTSDIWYAGTSAVHDMYETTYTTDVRVSPSWKDGKVLTSTDKGANWEILGDFETPIIWVETDPTNNDILYAAVISPDEDGGIWKATGISNISTVMWEHLPSPSDANLGRPHNIHVLNDGTIVTTWGVRKDSDSSTFHNGSGVFVSTDGGNTWDNKSHDDMKYWTQDLVIDPFDLDQNTWYICVWSGWGGPANDLGRLWRTTDRGDTWSPMTNEAQFHRVYSVAIDPADEETMYLTTETEGLWVTHNKSNANPNWNLVDSYPYLAPRRIDFDSYNSNNMWVSSFGGGMMYSQGISTNIVSKKENLVNLYPSPVSNIVYIQNWDYSSLQEVYIIDEKGVKIKMSLKDNSVDVSKLTNGIYMMQLISKEKTLTKKLLILRP